MTGERILLDTCALLWLAEGKSIAKAADDAIQGQWSAGLTMLVSPISAWEIGLLTSRGRLPLAQPPETWWDTLLGAGGLELAAMPPSVLIASSHLPGQPHTDPADRIIAATARAFGYRLMTRDRKLLGYAAAGHMQAIPC